MTMAFKKGNYLFLNKSEKSNILKFFSPVTNLTGESLKTRPLDLIGSRVDVVGNQLRKAIEMPEVKDMTVY